MNGILETYTSTFREKGSKFISYLIPVQHDDEIQDALKAVRSKYPDATHHCYAWRINPSQIREFSQDDGEPSGTAGLPILARLKSHQLINILGIVVRYYGGTKLGKTGLIKSYSYGIDLTMTDVKTVLIKPYCTFSITYPYHDSKTVEHLMKTFDIQPGDIRYTDNVNGEFFCPAELAERFDERLRELEWCGVNAVKKQIIHLAEMSHG
ncbi:MAG: YigZ family protein [Bacteroidetes bacterium]|nr:YigZ family protein [Bacteroidota bacterium]